MPWFEVTAEVQGADIFLPGFPRGESVWMVPSFCVNAEDESQAYAMAEAIVDPLHMTGLRTIEVKQLKGKKWERRK